MINTSPRRKNVPVGGFTLLELMVATAILVLLMLIVFQITQTTSRVWKNSTAQITSMQAARAAFESMTRRLSQATLNVYYGYDNPNEPTRYLRRSELQFVCGKDLVSDQITHSMFFQAPLGYTDDTPRYGYMENALNACGYYVVYDRDPDVPQFYQDAANPPPKYRFRLMEYLQPTQNLGIYVPGNDISAGTQPPIGIGWLNPIAANTRVLAENVVALIILPMRSIRDPGDTLAPQFEYDSRDGSWDGNKPAQREEWTHQLPPIVQVTMVAIDEDSAVKVCQDETSPDFGLDNLFQSVGRDQVQLQADLETLKNTLDAGRGNNAVPLNYHIFQTNVAIRGAKWSSQ
ncbi:MAG: Verru_Chthon cassette protein C [Verrucomicrobiales bacterium]|jgi:uncharacterized protein (TIGR02599 family)|nr:Verru_Chthon cassette protein C [Verrucomicrobiales bacterium]